MSMSLDGYIAGQHDEMANPGGDGFTRLHDWYGFEAAQKSEMGAHFLAEGGACGAIVAGRTGAWRVYRAAGA